MVAVDGGMGEGAAQGGEQGEEGGALGRGARVGWMAVAVEASDVANTYGAAVVGAAVGAGAAERTPGLDASVYADNEVITDIREMAVGNVPATDVGGGEVAPFAGSRAMDDNFVNLTAARFGGREDFLVCHGV